MFSPGLPCIKHINWFFSPLNKWNLSPSQISRWQKCHAVNCSWFSPLPFIHPDWKHFQLCIKCFLFFPRNDPPPSSWIVTTFSCSWEWKLLMQLCGSYLQLGWRLPQNWHTKGSHFQCVLFHCCLELFYFTVKKMKQAGYLASFPTITWCTISVAFTSGSEYL